MTVLIDPPTWPAHGTFFSHLVSDTNLQELHTFAAANNLTERAFDLDHYDVPAELYNRLIVAGACPVSGSELTRRLIASGLRVPFKERPAKIRKLLLERWKQVLPGRRQLGTHLLDQWEQAHRTYHNSAHLLEMLTTLDTLYGRQKPPRVVRLACWLHDIVYEGNPGQDEYASALFTRRFLAPLVGQELAEAEVAAIAELVEKTASHELSEPGAALVHVGLSKSDIARFFDADMAILAASPARYHRYLAGVRAEYAHYDDETFAIGRARFVRGQLHKKSVFASLQGQKLYELKAQKNLAGELSLRAEKKHSSCFSFYRAPSKSPDPQ